MTSKTPRVEPALQSCPSGTCDALQGSLRSLAAIILVLFGILRTRAVSTPDFLREIQPLLQRHCYECHGAAKQKSGLRWDSRESAFRGGESGEPVIAPGEIEKSGLIQRITSLDPVRRMPFKAEALASEEIALLTSWIASGAPWPADPANPLPEKKTEHWAFNPIQRVTPPATADSDWARNPIDQFVLAKLRQGGLTPAPEADRTTLIRRLSFDLRGLPPTPREVDDFQTLNSTGAFERLADSYLASAQFGERWAQDWLDVVRYAESEGFEYDRHLPDAWRYRDYVIAAANDDLPFDRFLAEQIAGDELGTGDSRALTAAIFHRLGPVRRNAGNPEIALSRNEVLTERTDSIGSAFLGLTIGCARCHDHKFDPVSQKDYYRLQAFLAATHETNVVLASAEMRDGWERQTKAATTRIADLKKAQKTAEGAERMNLESQIADLEKSLPPHLPTIPTITNAERTAIHVLKRGDWEKKGDAVAPRALSALVATETAELSPDTATPRTQLARWLTDPTNPLTARVIVNRIWQHYFGTGIVGTPNDFGMNGGRPSHPELLDWLAGELIRSGWRLKPIHRLILTSSTYRQSSRSKDATAFTAKDPDNRLLWHFHRRRLTAEEIRDSMLAISGSLNPKSGGPSVLIPVDQELVNLLYTPAQWSVTGDTAEHRRRSIYLIAKRNLRLPFMEVFDQPATLTSCARRESSTHAPQSLELLNGAFANETATTLARRLRVDAPEGTSAQVLLGYRLATGRSPTPRELMLALDFLHTQPLEEFTLALLNLNDFLYVK
jgi:hypothetical protein